MMGVQEENSRNSSRFEPLNLTRTQLRAKRGCGEAQPQPMSCTGFLFAGKHIRAPRNSPFSSRFGTAIKDRFISEAIPLLADRDNEKDKPPDLVVLEGVGALREKEIARSGKDDRKIPSVRADRRRIGAPPGWARRHEFEFHEHGGRIRVDPERAVYQGGEMCEGQIFQGNDVHVDFVSSRPSAWWSDAQLCFEKVQLAEKRVSRRFDQGPGGLGK